MENFKYDQNHGIDAEGKVDTEQNLWIDVLDFIIVNYILGQNQESNKSKKKQKNHIEKPTRNFQH